MVAFLELPIPYPTCSTPSPAPVLFRCPTPPPAPLPQAGGPRGSSGSLPGSLSLLGASVPMTPDRSSVWSVARDPTVEVRE